eukprot:6463151-Amphidinium_carterae.1
MLMLSGHLHVLTHLVVFNTLQARPEMLTNVMELHVQTPFASRPLARPGAASEHPHLVPSPSWLGQKGWQQ